MGWASSGFYLGSRVAQIWKNWQRGSAEGLSLAMFGCAIAANLTYGAGILCRAYSWAALLASAPWILGSLGTVALDVAIFLQVRTCCLGRHPSEVSAGPRCRASPARPAHPASVMQLQCSCGEAATPSRCKAARTVCTC